MFKIEIIKQVPVQFTGQHDFLLNRGLDTWGRLCDEFMIGERFTITQAAAVIFPEYSKRTGRAYISSVIKYVQKEYELLNDPDVPIKRAGIMYYL